MKRFAWLILVLLSSCGVQTAPTLEPAQGWESSGGDGVACFVDRRDAEATDKLVGVWPEDLRRKVESVTALEFFEHPELKYQDWKGKRREEILATMNDRFLKYSPIFHNRISLAAAKIRLVDWKPNSNLPDITDSKPKPEIMAKHPNCRIVQMAVRHSLSIPKKLPEVWVEVDQYLFENKMDALNQAILVLHEQMYLLGREIGHKSSDYLRQVVADLFSDEFAALLAGQKFPSLGARLLQTVIGTAYGDYYNFFLEDPATFLAVTPPGRHPYSRYRSFGTLLSLLRTRKGDCLERNDYDHQNEARRIELQEQCSFFAVNPALLPTLIDEEESFLFLARWLLDAVGAIDTSEIFVVWDPKDPTKESAYQRTERERACLHLKNSDYVYFRPIVKKALEYCRLVSSATP